MRFLNNPSELTGDVDRAIANYLSGHPYFKYVGKTTNKWDPSKRRMNLFKGLLASFHGWRLYPNKIEYGQYPYGFLWVAYDRQITKEGQFYQEFQQVIKNLLTHNIGDRHFGPILDPGKMSQMDWRESPWLFGNLNGYWLVREFPDLPQVQVFRWWWTSTAGWRLDFNRVIALSDGQLIVPSERAAAI